MKKLFLTAVAAALLSACSPVFYYAEYEKMAPNESGVNLLDRKVVVATRDSSDVMKTYAEAFAGYLRQDYGNLNIQCCHVDVLNENASLHNQMVSIAMKANCDVVFLLSGPVVKTEKNTKTAKSSLYVYDVFSQEDTVYTKHNMVSSVVSGKKVKSTEALVTELAEKASEPYQPVIKMEYVPFASYEGDLAWAIPASNALDMKLDEAIKAWTDMLGTRNLANKAALELNIASALYLQGRFDLAKEWLDLSKQTHVFEQTAIVEKLINKALK